MKEGQIRRLTDRQNGSRLSTGLRQTDSAFEVKENKKKGGGCQELRTHPEEESGPGKAC